MDPEQAQEFLRLNHRAVMSTTRGDGRPQMSPVTAGIDADGMVVVSSRETAIKVKNLRRDPTVGLCAFSDAFFGPWVQLEGTATIVALPEAMDGLVEYYRAIRGEHDDWDEYRTVMGQEQRVLIRFDIERAGPNRSG